MAKWKDSPSEWKKIYDGFTVADLSRFGDPLKVEINMGQFPNELSNTYVVVSDFFQEHKTPGMTRGLQYGVSGSVDEILKGSGPILFSFEKDALIVNSFMSDYGFARFGNNRTPEFDDQLTQGERDFYTRKLKTLGVVVRVIDYGGRDVLAERAGEGARSGLIEMFQGLVPREALDPRPNDIVSFAAEQVLRREAGLVPNQIESLKPVALSLSDAYGDCAVVYQARLKEGRSATVQPRFHTKHVVASPDELTVHSPLSFNPVALHVLQMDGSYRRTDG